MKEGTYMNQGSKEKPASIELRVTAKEKDKIQSKVRKCGLSTTEYVKQRALGYELRGIPTDALFLCLEKLSLLLLIFICGGSKFGGSTRWKHHSS